MALEARLKRERERRKRQSETDGGTPRAKGRSRNGLAKQSCSRSAFFQAAGIVQYDGSLVQNVARHDGCVLPLRRAGEEACCAGLAGSSSHLA